MLKLGVIFAALITAQIFPGYLNCCGHDLSTETGGKPSKNSHRNGRHGHGVKNHHSAHNNGNKNIYNIFNFNGGKPGGKGAGGKPSKTGQHADLEAWCKRKGERAAFIEGWCFAITETLQNHTESMKVCNRERNGRLAVLSTNSLIEQVKTKLLGRLTSTPAGMATYQISMRQNPGPSSRKDNWFWMMPDGYTPCIATAGENMPWFPTRPAGVFGVCGYTFDNGWNNGDANNPPGAGYVSDGWCWFNGKALCQYGRTPDCPLAG